MIICFNSNTRDWVTCKEETFRAVELDQWVKAFHAVLEDLSSIPGSVW